MEGRKCSKCRNNSTCGACLELRKLAGAFNYTPHYTEYSRELMEYLEGYAQWCDFYHV